MPIPKRFSQTSAGLRLGIALLSLAFVAPSFAKEAASMEGEAALSKLVKGNSRYATAVFTPLRRLAKTRRNLAEGQRPFAVVVACSDSRVSPEIVLNQSLGDLFVVRTAGNVVDKIALGSIEYAVEHLGARLVIVMGHERCGAVHAALKGGSAPGHVHDIVEAIRPAIKKAGKLPGDRLGNAVKENARLVAAKIGHSRPSLAKLAGGERVKIVPAYYDLHTGRIELLK